MKSKEAYIHWMMNEIKLKYIRAASEQMDREVTHGLSPTSLKQQRHCRHIRQSELFIPTITSRLTEHKVAFQITYSRKNAASLLQLSLLWILEF